MDSLSKSIKYLASFINSHYKDYLEAMVEYQPQKGYGDFPNSSEIVQCMRDITHNMEDKLSDLRIPENFAPSRHLIQTIKNFINILKNYESIFESTYKSYSNPERISVPVYEINKRRLETIEACEHFVEIANKELNHSNTEIDKMNEVEKITLGELFRFGKKLTLGSVLFIIGIVGIIVTITIFGTKAESNYKIGKLQKEIDNYKNNKRIVSINIDSLTNELRNKSIELDSLQNRFKILSVNYNDLLDKKVVEVSISYFEPKSIFDGTVLINAIDQSTFDLSVKNPNTPEEAPLRKPKVILKEMKALDKESATILNSILEMI